MLLVLCQYGEHLTDEMLQGLVEYILTFKVNEEKSSLVYTLLYHCALRRLHNGLHFTGQHSIPVTGSTLSR